MPFLKSVILFSVLLLASACSSDSSSSTADPNTFSGIVSGANLSGTVNFTVAETSSNGKLEANALTGLNAGTYDITGTYSAGGQTANVTGTAVVSAAGNIALNVTGTLAPSGNTLILTGDYDAATDTFTGTVTINGSQVGNFAVVAGTTGTPTLYCGTFTGSDSGVWNFTVGHDAGSAIAGAYSDDSGNFSGFLSGTRGTTNTVNVTFDVGSAQGTIDGSSAEGTWSAPGLGGSGQWTGGPC